MSESAEVPQNEIQKKPNIAPGEVPYREVQYGRIYDHLEANQAINIAALGNISIEIDEENLGLEKVSLENLQKGWEINREGFSKHCVDLGISLDPFEVYKYYKIQRKTFQVLGSPIQNSAERRKKQVEMGDHLKLSQSKGFAMCSEYAILSTYIAQKLGEPAHLIIGAAAEVDDELKWREAHAYIWTDSLNCIFDSVLAQGDNEYPALMKPSTPAILATLEEGKDVQAKRIGSKFSRIYGLEAGGFGVKMDHAPEPVK